MSTSMRVAASILVLGGLIAACSDDDGGPEIEGGAGLRFIFPAGADTLEGVRLELWHRNQVSPPGCLFPSSPGIRLLAASPAEVDSCTKMSVLIWNLAGKLVRDEESLPFIDRLSWPWDGIDDLGNPVPSGYYPVFSRCLDSRGSFTFRGHYYVIQDREWGTCDWPLWIEELGPGSAVSGLSFGPFPDAAQTWRLDPTGQPQSLVNFVNPFLVRVHASGMKTFEEEIVLVEGFYTEVAVDLVPVAAVGGQMQ